MTPIRGERRGKLDELWKTFVYVDQDVHSDTNDKIFFAIGELRRYSEKRAAASSTGDWAGALAYVSIGIKIWTVLNAEISDWLSYADAINLPFPTASIKEQATLALAASAPVLLPGFDEVIDPVPVLLPINVLRALVTGLAALDVGETQPLFEPAQTGRHGDTYSWDQMRCQATARVRFYKGTGLTLKRARDKVAKEMQVSPETLRKYEKEFSADHFVKIAEAAGALKAAREVDPCRRIYGADPLEDAYLEAIAETPLREFGRQYRERFGYRHNTPSGGD